MFTAYTQHVIRFLLAEHGQELPAICREWASSEEDRGEAVRKYASQINRDFENWFLSAPPGSYSGNEDRFVWGIIRTAMMRTVWTRVSEYLLDRFAPLPRPAERFDMLDLLPECDLFRTINRPSVN